MVPRVTIALLSNYHGRIDQVDTSMVISKEEHGKCVVVSLDLCTTHGNVEEAHQQENIPQNTWLWLAHSRQKMSANMAKYCTDYMFDCVTSVKYVRTNEYTS